MIRITRPLVAAAALYLSPSVVAAEDFELPPYVRAYEPQGVDERGMWMQADEVERSLQHSPLVIRDEELQAYVEGVLCRTVGADRCEGVRVYILEMPAFNATMYPNGLMTVWSGLLLRVRSEAELGAVLGHEFGHFEQRHGLEGFKKARSSTDAMAWLSVLGGMANTSTYLSQVATLGSFYSFKREQEEEADMIGLAYLGRSDYPSAAASTVWQNLMAEHDATYEGRKLKRKQRYSAGYFDTHPTGLKRAEYLAEAAGEIGDTGDTGVSGHFAAMEPFIPRFLDAQAKLNDFGGTEFILNQLAEVSGWTPNLLYARGQMYQQRGNPRDLVSAAQFYREAIAAGYTEPAVHRNLGLSLLRTGAQSEAALALNTYLQLAPAAEDASLIRSMVPPGASIASAKAGPAAEEPEIAHAPDEGNIE